jgi:hypothetical protein
MKRGVLKSIALDVAEALLWLLVIAGAVIMAGLLNAVGWPG